MSTDIDESRFAKLEQLSDEYAEAQATASFLDDYTKSLLAMLMKEAETKGATSATIQEREARRSEAFVTHLKGKQAATEAAIKARGRWELARMKFEWARTKAANRRAEMNLR
jgi:hypothetical protein